MSVSKKLRALNRARTEHDNARLSAQFAAAKDTMNHIADSVMAKEIKRQAAQIDQLRDRLQSAAIDAEMECERKLDILRAQLADTHRQLVEAQAENLRLACEVANRNGRAIYGDKAVIELNKALDRLDIAEGNHAGLLKERDDHIKREVMLRKLVGEIYCSDDSGMDVMRKIGDVLAATDNMEKPRNEMTFDDWWGAYPTQEDYEANCRDAWDASAASRDAELEEQAKNLLELSKLASSLSFENGAASRDAKVAELRNDVKMLRSSLKQMRSEYERYFCSACDSADEALAATKHHDRS